MHRFLLLLVAVLSFAGSWLAVWAAWPRNVPELWTNATVVDHGDLFQGQEVHTEFQFENRYSEVLEITDVYKSCGCSEAVFSARVMNPGERASVQVVWKTGRTRGRNSIAVDVFYSVGTSTAQRKSLRIEGNVVPDIVCRPEKLTFDGKKKEVQLATLAAGRMATFSIGKAYCNHPAFKVETSGANTIKVVFDGDTPVFADGAAPRLIIETSSPNEPQMFVPLEIVRSQGSRE